MDITKTSKTRKMKLSKQTVDVPFFLHLAAGIWCRYFDNDKLTIYL